MPGRVSARVASRAIYDYGPLPNHAGLLEYWLRLGIC